MLAALEIAVVDPVITTLLVAEDVNVIPVAVEFQPPTPVPVDIAVEFVPVALVEEFDDVVEFAVGLGQPAVKNTYFAAQPRPAHEDPHGKFKNTVGIALGHPQDCVSGSSSTQSGIAQLLQMLLVRVTVGHPVCMGSPALVLPVTTEYMMLEMVVIGVEVA